MRRILWAALLLACATALWAQSPRPAANDKKDGDLAPPPYAPTFQGRPVYSVNDEEIRPPSVMKAPDPPPLKDFGAGTVVLWCVVGTDGKAYMIKVAKHYTLEADMKAVANLKEWKFSPAVTRKKNEAVDVLMKVEVMWR